MTEVLGVGGTVAKLAAGGHDAIAVIVTRADPPRFPDGLVPTARREAAKAHAILGYRDAVFLDFPAAELDQVPHADINHRLGEISADVRPDTVFLPFPGNIHLDHQRVSLSALVCTRPARPHQPGVVLAYETLSESNWNVPYVAPSFVPNVFYDITPYLAVKLQAMQCYASQLQEFPAVRSLEAIRALAEHRGAQVARHAAEAFLLVRQVM